MTRLMQSAIGAFALGGLVAGGILLAGGAASEDSSGATPRIRDTFHSTHLDADLVVLQSVFGPNEAERFVLPFMKENARRFGGASVLEIGTGSGIISLYAARLGASRIVATDINPSALENAMTNARRMELEGVIETRLVSRDDMSAYAVIGPGERFDVIISNPPYSLNLDAPTNDAVVDRGDLGFSIVRGLDAHLEPGGTAMLLYQSLFYHLVMVGFARNQGFEARGHAASFITRWEAEALFNHYLARLLEAEGVEPDAFRFDAKAAPLRKVVIGVMERFPIPLFPTNSSRRHPGMIVIERDGD